MLKERKCMYYFYNGEKTPLIENLSSIIKHILAINNGNVCTRTFERDPFEGRIRPDHRHRQLNMYRTRTDIILTDILLYCFT